MEVLTNKIRLLASTISLLRLRGRIITNPLVKKENLDLIETMKAHFQHIKPEMLNFLYCYLFFHFDEFLNSTIAFDTATETIRIDSYDKDGPYDQYRRSTIELIDDEVAPIKISTQTVKMLEGEDFAILSSDVTYSNTKALEMIKLQSGEHTKSVFFFKKIVTLKDRLEELYKVARLYPKEVISYRSEDDLYTINNILRTKTGYTTEIIRADKKHIDSLTPETVISIEDNNYPQEATMPYLVREYLDNIQIKNEALRKKEWNKTPYNTIKHELEHISSIDSDIAKFIMNKETDNLKVDDDITSDPKTI